MKEDIHIYDDIINMNAYKSTTRAKLTSWQRAAQFAPFAALTGYEECIEAVDKQNNDLSTTFITHQEY